MSFFGEEPLFPVSSKTSTSSVENVGFCWIVDNLVFGFVDLSVVVVVLNVVTFFGFLVVGGGSM